MGRHGWGSAAAIALIAALAIAGTAEATPVPAPSGDWFVATVFNPGSWGVRMERTPEGFVGRLTRPAQLPARFWHGGGNRPCPGPPPSLPAGTVFVTATRTGDDTFAVTLPYAGFQSQSENGIQSDPFACPILSVTRSYQLLSFDAAIAAGAVTTAFPFPGRPDVLCPVLGAAPNYDKHCDPGPGVDPVYANRTPYPDGDPSVSFCGWSSGGSFFSSIPVPAQDLGDRDGDGLLDTWETDGLTVGGRRVDLRAMGAKPDHKDLFLEIDQIEGSWLPQTMLDRMAAQFRTAPVSNPDGRAGITLHLDAGPDSLMDPPTGRRWGRAASAGEVFAGPEELGSVGGQPCNGAATGDYDWTAFDDLRAQHFKPERQPVFRYAIAAFRVGDGTCISGIAKGIPSSVFTFQTDFPDGASEEENGVDTPGVVSLYATLVHELGHTLGLRHGGEDHVGYKPNYLSVMNYAYQLTGIRRDNSGQRYAFWSAQDPSAATAVDEHAVDERHAMAGVAPESWWLQESCPDGTWFSFHPGQPKDLDCAHGVDAAPHPVNVNGDLSSGGGPLLSTLQTQNDFAALQFAGGVVGGAGRPAERSGVLPSTETVSLTKQIADARSIIGDRKPPSFTVRVRKRTLTIRARDDKGLGGVAVTRRGDRVASGAFGTAGKLVRKGTLRLKVRKVGRLTITVGDAAFRVATRSLRVH
jgi:hypothetical protein